jgi:hypothetical protein
MSGFSSLTGGGGFSNSASSSSGPASSGGYGGGLFIQGITTGGYAGQGGSSAPSGAVPQWVYIAAVVFAAAFLVRGRR